MTTHCSTIRERRRLSSVSRFANPSPRARSRVACTASRDTGSGLVDAEQLDGEAMRLAPDALLERGDLGAQLGVRRRCDPQLEGGAEQRAGVHLDDPVDDGAGPAGPDGKLVAVHPQVADPRRHQLVDGGGEQRLAGREVVLRRPA